MRSFILLLTTLIGGVQLIAQPEVDALIFPDPARKIVLVTADSGRFDMPHGITLPADTPLSIHIHKELSHPFIQSLLRLNQCSRNLAGNEEGPNVLFLSQNQGGFARQRLVLNVNGQVATFPSLNYVDPSRLEAGELDIFPHKLVG
jgi:hypothetical protein